MSGPSLTTPEPALPTGNNPEGGRGLQAVLRLNDFRKLWIGQIFSQLADKFYIVLMVFLIDQHLMLTARWQWCSRGRGLRLSGWTSAPAPR